LEVQYGGKPTQRGFCTISRLQLLREIEEGVPTRRGGGERVTGNSITREKTSMRTKKENRSFLRVAHEKLAQERKGNGKGEPATIIKLTKTIPIKRPIKVPRCFQK